MFQNYFKTAFRSLWKKKSFSLLNIVGLAVGITCASLIFLWVEDELTYNDYFKKKDNLYQLLENQAYDGKIFTFASQPGKLGPAIKEEIPGIKTAVRTNWSDRALLGKDEKSLYANGMMVEPEFFDLFSIEFIKGNSRAAFSQVHSIVLNERMALKLFNTVDVVGKTVKVDDDQEYLIGGVYKALPRNAKFENLEWFAPFEGFFKKNPWLEQWGNNGIQTYVELQPESDPALINAKLKNFIKGKDSGAIAQPFLLAAKDWRLRSNFVDGKQSGGRIKYVNLFSIIAWIIIVLACINFMNLATARSEQRAREVGVRKVMGSGKNMLIIQFMVEALVMSFIAVLVSVAITYFTLPAFNKMVDKSIALNLFAPAHLISLLVIALLCGLIAGSYPAFYLSSFNPITVLKGLKLPGGFGVAAVRKVLVTAQFVISIGLIVCTVVIYQQVMHTKSRELGLNKENLIFTSQQIISVQQEANLGLRFNSFRNDLLATGLVENAALSNGQAFNVGSSSSDFKWKTKDPGKELLISMEWATPGYLGTMGMKLISGRDFYPNGKSDSNNIIINESFAKLVAKNPADATGELIDRDGSKLMVIGVVKDFVYNNIYSASSPLVIFNDADAKSTSTLNIRFKKDADIKQALAKTEAVIKTYNAAYPFEYRFVDQEFEKLFTGESLIGNLAAVFSGLAIFISCLGLFGLAAYTAEKRIREIGIRKVLGASVVNLTSLLSIDFLKLVVISCIVAFPVSWWMMNNWLHDYEYRVNIQWWMFAVPGVLALVVALFTVSFQAIKAALTNPVKSLKSE